MYSSSQRARMPRPKLGISVAHDIEATMSSPKRHRDSDNDSNDRQVRPRIENESVTAVAASAAPSSGDAETADSSPPQPATAQAQEAETAPSDPTGDDAHKKDKCMDSSKDTSGDWSGVSPKLKEVMVKLGCTMKSPPKKPRETKLKFTPLFSTEEREIVLGEAWHRVLEDMVFPDGSNYWVQQHMDEGESKEDMHWWEGPSGTCIGFDLLCA